MVKHSECSNKTPRTSNDLEEKVDIEWPADSDSNQ